VDGTGAPPFVADVAVTGELITAVGQDLSRSMTAARTVDATGHIVTPGFCDIHTHCECTLLLLRNTARVLNQPPSLVADDGQITWDPLLSPSTQHGVTTVMFGNCGVGFAPCRPDSRDKLIEVLEGAQKKS